MNDEIQRCVSVKSKNNLNEQCVNKRLNDSELCGVHKRSKAVIKYVPNNDNNINNNINKLKKSHSLNKLDFAVCPNYDKLSLDDIKQYILKLKLKVDIPINQNTKREIYGMIVEYYDKLDNYRHHENKIIQLQSYIRRFLIQQRTKCVNMDDFYSLDSKYEIPSKYYFSFVDEDGFKYCYDIRSLKKMFETSDKKMNPYNFKLFSEKVIAKIYLHIEQLNEQKICTLIKKDIVSPEKQFELNVVDVFHKYDELDNYTNHQWFLNLSFLQLRELYKRCEDIWNYRSELTIESKKNIVKNGIAFNIPLPLIYIYRPSQKRILQKIILEEFERFATEGINISERKLGTMLMLSALVEVSPEAADGLPYFVQVN